MDTVVALRLMERDLRSNSSWPGLIPSSVVLTLTTML